MPTQAIEALKQELTEYKTSLERFEEIYNSDNRVTEDERKHLASLGMKITTIHNALDAFNPEEDSSAQLENAQIDLDEAIQLCNRAGSADSNPELIERGEKLLDRFEEMLDRLDETGEPDEAVLLYLGQLRSVNKAIRNLSIEVDLYVAVVSGSTGDPLADVEVLVKTKQQGILKGFTESSGVVKFTGVQTPQSVKVLAIGEEDRREKEVQLTAPSNGEYIKVEVGLGDPDAETQEVLLKSVQDIMVNEYEQLLRRADASRMAEQQKMVDQLGGFHPTGRIVSDFEAGQMRGPSRVDNHRSALWKIIRATRDQSYEDRMKQISQAHEKAVAKIDGKADLLDDLAMYQTALDAGGGVMASGMAGAHRGTVKSIGGSTKRGVKTSPRTGGSTNGSSSGRGSSSRNNSSSGSGTGGSPRDPYRGTSGRLPGGDNLEEALAKKWKAGERQTAAAKKLADAEEQLKIAQKEANEAFQQDGAQGAREEARAVKTAEKAAKKAQDELKGAQDELDYANQLVDELQDEYLRTGKANEVPDEAPKD